MKFRCLARTLACGVFCAVLVAQTKTPAPASPEMSQKEQDSLREALGEAGNSQVDFERALENHLEKYPNSPKRAEMERALIKTAIELKDNPRIILYGEKVLQREPDDMQILERVTVALLQTGGTENQERALKHAEHFAEVVKQTEESEKDLNSRDKVRHKDDHDRAAARSLLLEARANGVLGNSDQAIALAEKSYETFPSVEGAREAARWLDKAGQTDKAIEYMADSFSISGLQSANPDGEEDRKSIGELYRKLNGSEKGLGDLILKSYDRTYTELLARREERKQADPNAQVKDPMDFTISDLAGAKLQLSSLKGKVVVMDFWATWCGPCRAQHPLYEETKKRFKDRDDVIFIAVATDEDHSLVKPFLEKQNWSQKVYFDDGLVQLLQVSSIPMTLILNKQGEVFSRMNGFIPERFVGMLSDRINEALGVTPKVQATNK